MKNILKTAVAVCVLGGSQLMMEVANAASFKFTQLLSNGNSITGEVEGTLADDLNTVEDPVLKWWQVNDADGEKLLGGEVEETEYKEEVRAFSIDGSNNSMTFNSHGIRYQTPFPHFYHYAHGSYDVGILINYLHISIYSSTNRDTVSVRHDLLGIEGSIADVYWEEGLYEPTWKVIEVVDQTEVPEPTAIVGSLLAVALGAKVLKCGKKQ